MLRSPQKFSDFMISPMMSGPTAEEQQQNIQGVLTDFSILVCIGLILIFVLVWCISALLVSMRDSSDGDTGSNEKRWAVMCNAALLDLCRAYLMFLLPAMQADLQRRLGMTVQGYNAVIGLRFALAVPVALCAGSAISRYGVMPTMRMAFFAVLFANCAQVVAVSFRSQHLLLAACGITQAGSEFCHVATIVLRARLMKPDEQSTAQGVVMLGFPCGVLGVMMISPLAEAKFHVLGAFMLGVIVSLFAVISCASIDCILRSLPANVVAALHVGEDDEDVHSSKYSSALKDAWPLLMISTLGLNSLHILRENMPWLRMQLLHESHWNANASAALPSVSRVMLDVPVGLLIDKVGQRLMFLAVSAILLGGLAKIQVTSTDYQGRALLLYGAAWSVFSNATMTLYPQMVKAACVPQAYSLMNAANCLGMVVWGWAATWTSHGATTGLNVVQVYAYGAAICALVLWALQSLHLGNGRASMFLSTEATAQERD